MKPVAEQSSLVATILMALDRAVGYAETVGSLEHRAVRWDLTRANTNKEPRYGQETVRWEFVFLDH